MGWRTTAGIAPPSARKKKILLPALEVARRIAELLLFGVGRRRKFLYSLARSREAGVRLAIRR